MKDAFYISTDKSKLDLELIHRFLSSDSYWAIGRTLETVETSIQHALCFGVYKDDRQVGFARVVTDYSVFAWILDVFILKDFRKKGLGKMLMDAIMRHLNCKKCSVGDWLQMTPMDYMNNTDFSESNDRKPLWS